VRTQHAPARQRPGPLQWLWYAYGGGLPRTLAPWVLADVTARTWVWRHLARAVFQMLPVLVICLVAVPVPFAYRASAAFGGLLLGLFFSMAFMVEILEHRSVKAGFEPGLATQVREERADRDRLERRSPYRVDGSGSFD